MPIKTKNSELEPKQFRFYDGSTALVITPSNRYQGSVIDKVTSVRIRIKPKTKTSTSAISIIERLFYVLN